MMDKIELGTPEGTTENIDKIAELFPQVVTEVENADGKLARAVDFDALRDLLGDVAEGQRERYQFTWPGKREAKAEARCPIYKTMIPEPGKSKDWDTTENLYIEGDNLDALKILKETYAGKVKLIYIDPPYNTGHDFIYDDDFAKTRGEYDAESGDFDEEGGRLVANTEGNGRFHSDWCSMIYPRLLLARDLLTSDGSILLSIDANEVKNLRAICDEIFGAQCFKNCIAVRRGIKNVQAQFDDIAALSQGHEYILLYSRNATNRFHKLSLAHDGKPGKWDTFWRGTDRPSMRYELFGETPHSGQWRWEKGRAYTAVSNYSTFLKDAAGSMSLDEYYLDNLAATNEKMNFVRKNEDGTVQYYVPPSTGKLLSDNWMDLTLSGNETDTFDTEKSVAIIQRIVEWLAPPNSIVLDFFSGSGTTAHAVIEANKNDNGQRRFIMVQLPENCGDNPSAIKHGYKTLCDLGEDRINRAGAKIAADIDKGNEQLELGAEPKLYPDLGFRVLRIDSSNFKDFYLTPGEISQESLFDFADNVKEGRSDLDLLFEVLPKLGIPYSAKIEERVLADKKVFFVDGDKLAACFDANVGSDTIEEMAKAKPWYAVIRDSSMADDATHANYEELFRTYSPDTVPQVI
ncbi:MAG: site-specific DNA-methyltransferase [Parolsenella sp.]|uniref:site-specific DNA-methyltransferase n=1 Tax=Parolsenella sp. TaxID=2083006 RepID=UPI002E77E2A7|nr:site-specific DNA-methyltransferase [Parolsenella sp.]MEE1373337.1 site-specific DNA-methyltransferase [Parolsenella sp.]